MGVKACSRSGCGSIMCDTYVPEIGYVCPECQREFENYLIRKRNIFVVGSVKLIRENLRIFLAIEKEEFPEDEQSIRDWAQKFFDSHTA